MFALYSAGSAGTHARTFLAQTRMLINDREAEDIKGNVKCI